MSFLTGPDLTLYRPEFKMKIGGKSVPSKKDPLPITSVSVTEKLREAGSMTINISDPEDRWTDGKLLRIGNDVTLELGYTDKLTKFITGHIEKVSVSYPSSGTPQVTVTVYDDTYELLRSSPSEKTSSFEDKTISDIIKALVKDAKLKVDVDATKKIYKSFMLATDKSYLEHIQDLTWRITYDFFLRSGTLYVKKADLGASSIATLEWGKTLISFSPSLNISKQVSKVVLTGKKTGTGEEITGTATASSLSVGSGLISGSDLFKKYEKRDLKLNMPVKDQEEANEFAKAKLMEINQDLITGNCSCIGDPGIHPGGVVEIKNVAKIYKGKYIVTNATHTMGSDGYRTTFGVRRGGAGK